MMYIAIAIGIIVIFIISAKPKSPSDALFGNPGDFLSIFNKGFCLTGGLRATTREQAFRNALIVGNTGSGKTSAVLLGSLFTLSRSESSIVVLDVSAENFKLSSGYLSKRRKRKIYCFDFSETSDGFNPLALCKTVSDLDKVAHVLIKNSGVDSKSDPFWSTSSEMILSLFMQYLFFYGKEEEKNMANVVLLLEVYMAEPEKIDLLFIKANERLLRTYKTINAIPDKTRQSILSTALAATKLFKSPEVARCTSINTFDIAMFRKECSVLYLCIPLNQVHFLAPLTAVLFEMLFQEALSRIPNKKENPIYFLIDEMITMKLGLGLVYSNCRKYFVGCMGLIQDEKMLGMKYSASETFAIKSNSCSRVYLPGQGIETCRELQEIIGKCLIKDENGHERHSYAMEASHIRTSDQAIILINSALPLKERITPYFRHFLYNARTKIPPYEPEQKILFKDPPLIQID
ncbi:MAG: type IV secretory system conjugative DNA transfer family protein [Chitinophagaceae bacterium]|nr:type IV secretory system conjugative DNA transfer family protein [Chitinophagaceae bacterium]